MIQPVVKIENGCLVIHLPLQTPTMSSTGKSTVVASTHGNQATAVQIEGKPVIIGVNAYIKN